MHTKKPYTLLLAALCLVCCVRYMAVKTAAAEVTSAQASTMHLEKTQGTVDIRDSEQEQIPTRTGMQLYSGYALETAKKSLAWLSLDKTKAIKLAEASSAQVMQSGRQLELTLNEGSLFFDISKPLEAEESLKIRTSTMVVGIRGTSGWIWVIDNDTVQVALLDGSITAEDTNPDTGEVRQVTLLPGQILTIVNHGEGEMKKQEEDSIKKLMEKGTIDPRNVIQNGFGLRIEALDEDTVPPWVQEEVGASPQLQERIREGGVLSVSRILKQEQTPLPVLPPEPTPEEDSPEPAPEENPTPESTLTLNGLPDTCQYQWAYSPLVSGGSGTGTVSCEITSGDRSGLFIAPGNPFTVIPEKLGTYTLTFTKAADGQYPAESISHTFTVVKANPKVMVMQVAESPVFNNAVTIPYTGNEHAFYFGVYGLAREETDQIEFTWYDSANERIDSPIKVGTYTLKATLEGNDFHYPLEETPVLTLTIEKGEYPYDKLTRFAYIPIGSTQGQVSAESLLDSLIRPDGLRIESISATDSSSAFADVSHDGATTITYTIKNPDAIATYNVYLASDDYNTFQVQVFFTLLQEEKANLKWNLRHEDEYPYSSHLCIGYTSLELPPDYFGDHTIVYTPSGSSDSSSDPPIEPGSYHAVITLLDTDKYFGASYEWDFTITPADDTATVSDDSEPAVDNSKNRALRTTREGIPEDDIPEEDTTEDDIPEEDIPEDDTPVENTPEEDTPEDDIPEDDTPEDDTPEDDTPEGDLPEDDTPEDNIPEEDIPVEDTPEENTTE